MKYCSALLLVLAASIINAGRFRYKLLNGRVCGGITLFSCAKCSQRMCKRLCDGLYQCNAIQWNRITEECSLHNDKLNCIAVITDETAFENVAYLKISGKRKKMLKSASVVGRNPQVRHSCDDEPCGSNGQCTKLPYYNHFTSGRFRCSCSAGYMGTFCDEQVKQPPRRQVNKTKFSATDILVLATLIFVGVAAIGISVFCAWRERTLVERALRRQNEQDRRVHSDY